MVVVNTNYRFLTSRAVRKAHGSVGLKTIDLVINGFPNMPLRHVRRCQTKEYRSRVSREIPQPHRRPQKPFKHKNTNVSSLTFLFNLSFRDEK